MHRGDYMDKKITVKHTTVITLKGDILKTYLNILIKLVRGGRLNKFFPDAQKICNLFNFLYPENCYNLYDSLSINYDTGLPSEESITRVIVDRRMAEEHINKESEDVLRKEYEKDPTPVKKRRLNRFLYYEDLIRTPLPNSLSLTLKLRSADVNNYIAYFNAEIERFDISSQMFTKYTLVVGQEEAKWLEKQQVILVGDTLKYTQRFRNLLSEYTVNEAEFAFVLLNDLKGVKVEEVKRCQIGPLYFKGVKIPEGMEEIFQKHPNAFILSLPTDRASIYIKEDKNNDPLVRMYRDTLDPESRKLRDKKAEQIGYHVYKERKFVCTRNALRDFRLFLKKRGARCVVYGV